MALCPCRYPRPPSALAGPPPSTFTALPATLAVATGGLSGMPGATPSPPGLAHQLILEQINLVASNRNQALTRRRLASHPTSDGSACNGSVATPPHHGPPDVGEPAAPTLVPLAYQAVASCSSPASAVSSPSPAALSSAASHLQVHQLLIGRAQGSQLEMRQLEWLSRRCGFQLWRPTATAEICSICQDALLQGEPVATTPCIHHFHASCLAQCQSSAFGNSGVCPCCRSSLEPSPSAADLARGVDGAPL